MVRESRSARDALAALLPEQDRDAPQETLRWRVAVPLLTNPFLMLEVALFSFSGSATLFLMTLAGLRFVEGGLSAADVRSVFFFCGWLFIGLVALWAGIALLFFRNRYYAVYRCDRKGIYYEGSRGTDESGRTLPLRLAPWPVIGAVRAVRTHGRFIPWQRVSRFAVPPGSRVIQLKRGFWHMAWLYTPDQPTHEAVVRYLSQRLRRTG